MTPDKNNMHADTEQLLRRLAAQEHELRMSDEQTGRLLASIESGYRRQKRYRMYSRVLQSAAALVLLAVAGAAYTLHHEELEQLATDARGLRQHKQLLCFHSSQDFRFQDNSVGLKSSR